MIERRFTRSSRASRSGRPTSGGPRQADLELAPKESLL
jgi:hypothetical protein